MLGQADSEHRHLVVWHIQFFVRLVARQLHSGQFFLGLVDYGRQIPGERLECQLEEVRGLLGLACLGFERLASFCRTCTHFNSIIELTN